MSRLIVALLLCLAPSAQGQLIHPIPPDVIRAGIARTRPSRPPVTPTAIDYFEVWLYRDGLTDALHIPVQAVRIIATPEDSGGGVMDATTIALPAIDPDCGGDMRRFAVLMEVNAPPINARGTEAWMRPGKVQTINFLVLDEHGFQRNAWAYEVTVTADDLQPAYLLARVPRRRAGR